MVGKQVDLVDYHTGVKRVIGRASINEVGHIEAQISKLYKPEIMELLSPTSVVEVQFSLGTVPPPAVVPQVAVRTTTTTTRIVPPS